MLAKILVSFFLVSTAIAGPTSRIVGGEGAIDGQFPYVVSIRDAWDHSHYCGGAIFHERWVVTSAFCMQNATTINTRIVAGSATLRGGLNAFTHAINLITIHPDYTPGFGGSDIALVRVSVPFLWSQFIQPIRLGSEFTGGFIPAVTMGWGSTRMDGVGSYTETLQWVNTNTMNNPDCARNFGVSEICECQLCTFAAVGRGVCIGDEGSPLVAQDSLVGIVSQSIPCAVGFPDVYTRISTFHSWILTNSILLQ